MTRLAATVALIAPLVVACGAPRTAGSGTDSSSDTDSADTGATDTSSSDGVRFDVSGEVFDLPPDPPLDCKLLEGTEVSGEGPLGPFASTAASTSGAWPSKDRFSLIVFDETADVEHEMAHAGTYGGNFDVGPVLILHADAEFDQLPAIVPVEVEHLSGDTSTWFMADLIIDSIQNLQNQQYPIIVFHGALAAWDDDAFAGVSGPISASYCSAFERFFPIE